MSIFLIRHGETELNAARVLQPADTPLSVRGRAQAAQLARRLQTLGIARIISSDLPRALQTAEAIAAATGAPITTTPLLQERNFGDLRGRPYDTLDIDPIGSEAAPPGGESMAQFGQRVEAAWREVARALARIKPEGHLAVVSHGLVIRLLLAAIVPQGQLPAHLGNTSLSIVDPVADTDAARPGEHRFVARRVNCLEHLERSQGDDPQALSGG